MLGQQRAELIFDVRKGGLQDRLLCCGDLVEEHGGYLPDLLFCFFQGGLAFFRQPQKRAAVRGVFFFVEETSFDHAVEDVDAGGGLQ